MTQTARKTRAVAIGSVTIGGARPVAVQGMTNTLTCDVDATVRQINALADAGAAIVRVAVPTAKDTAALPAILSQVNVPIVADVHFQYRRALEAIEGGVQKLRLNPGNLRDRQALARVISAAKTAGVAIRIGVNAGSIRTADQLGRKFSSDQLVTLMLQELAEYVRFFEKAGFEQLVLSAKSSDVILTIKLYEALAREYDYPLHVGLTHAGTAWTGSIRSASALAVLLNKGIGETIRVSLAGDPVREIHAAKEILFCLGLDPRDRPEVIVCPTCGRCTVDIAKIAEQVERRMAGIRKPVRVAVMGCVVNGPGEASDADVALIAGKDFGFVYRAGERVAKLPTKLLIGELIRQVRTVAAAMK